MIWIRDGEAHVQPCADIPSDGNEMNDWITSISTLYAPLTELLPLAGAGMLGTYSPQDEPRLIARLRDEAPWMEGVITQIADHLALSLWSGQPWLHVPPLLLVGAPGSGKTHFARRLGEIAGCGSGMLSFAGIRDNSIIAGNPRGYRHQQPCFPAMVMMRTMTANPVLVIDEVDKARGSDNGDPLASLLGMMEKASAQRHFDGCLGAEIDISHVSWILTANSIADLPAPLLSRLTVIAVSGPGPEHAEQLLAILWRDLAAKRGLHPAELPPLDPKVEARLLGLFKATRSVRRLRRALEVLLAIAVRHHERQLQ